MPSDGAFDGRGQWLPIVVDGISQVPGFTTEQALVFTRLAADAVGATKMDRPRGRRTQSSGPGRSTSPAPTTPPRQAPARKDPPSPTREPCNRDGHVIEITERNGDARSTTFSWNILLVCGDPAVNTSTYFAGFPADQVSPISCPDNVAFDSRGDLWIATDGAPGAIGYNDGLFKVPAHRPRARPRAAVPVRAAGTPRPAARSSTTANGLVFVAVQHPGEEGTFSRPALLLPGLPPADVTPQPGQWRGPRPSVLQVWHD